MTAVGRGRMNESGSRRVGSLAGVVLAAVGALCGLALLVALAPPLGTFLSRFVTTLLLATLVLWGAIGCTCAADRVLAQLLRRPACAFGVEAAIVGLPLLGSACFLVGLFSTHPGAMGAVVLLAAAFGVSRMRGVSTAAAVPLALDATSLFSAWLVAIALGVGLFVAQLPPTHLDELAYHLYVPKAWVVAGQVVELPLNSHSYFPMGVESAYLPLLSVAGPLGAQAARVLHWLTAVLVLVVVARSLGERLSPGGKLWVCALVITTPCLFLATGLALVEWPLLGLCVLALLGLEDAVDGKERGAVPIELVWAAGMATKYTFALYALIVAGVGVASLWRRPRELRRWLLAGATGLGLGSVFLLRNFLSTGNPVEPFGGPHGASIAAFMSGDSAGAQVSRYLLDPSMLDESLGVALPMAALCGLWALVSSRPPGPSRWVGALMWVPLCALAWAGYVGRILLPFVLVPALVGLVAVHERVMTRAWVGPAVALSWLVLAATQLLAATSVVASHEPHAFLLSGEAAYVAKRRSYAALRWLDGELPPESQTLVLGLHELYPSDRNVRGGGNSDGPRVARYLEAASPQALARRWGQDGFTHVAIYPRRISVGDGPSAPGLAGERFMRLAPSQASVLRAALDSHATLLATGHGISAYVIASDDVE